METTDKNKPKVGLFVTCLVDLFRPSVGFSAVELIEKSGCEIDVPMAQTCCGQPAYNSGDKASTREIAIQVLELFEDYDYVVAPSGSCAAMIKKHYIELFEDGDPLYIRMSALADKTYELISFLTDIMFVTQTIEALDKTVTYHDSCSGLRELGIEKQPRKLLSGIKDLNVEEMKDSDVCCGFGGTFCVKYSDISNAIVEKKTQSIKNTEADMLLAGDMGCLMNMAGKLKREGSDIEVRHVAEVLAGKLDTKPISGN
ncbi:(Fe-S)-binding protein [Lentilitoribacter sp. EG35]|uniref:(Fe-S)-binding protein n=1 Tax=Lentilitoribacter sp. EG35 TaxID=3234192 RepID=UPI00346167EA